jgi:hypothetical protein
MPERKYGMVFVYIVRCRFNEPEKEQAWNAWYSGPKIMQMLAKPYFRSCQRFRLESGNGRDYLALWTVQSPEAFRTREYGSDWGFFEWARNVTDWSRDLFDGGPAPETAFAVAAQGALHVVTFDGMTREDADMARAVISESKPRMIWLPVIGLDRHTPMIGLEPLSDLNAARYCGRDGGQRVQEAIYRPISQWYTASMVRQAPAPCDHAGGSKQG